MCDDLNIKGIILEMNYHTLCLKIHVSIVLCRKDRERRGGGDGRKVSSEMQKE